MEFSDQLENCLAEHGFKIRGSINYSLTGKFQRFANDKKGKNSKDLFVVLHDYDRGATFGDWHYPEEWKTFWNPAYGNPTIIDLLERKREKLQRESEQRYERAKAQHRAALFFSRSYALRDASSHPYIIKKKILPYHAAIIRSWLIIPVRDIDYNFITLQIIKSCGFKRLWKKTSAKNYMMWLCDKLPDDYSGVIRICEGYATGCTIRQVTSSPVVCSVWSDNMPFIAKQLRVKFPNANIKICADNDQWGKENIGFKAACLADNVCNAFIYWPDFAGMDVSSKPTDFNDLFNLAGNEAVKRQLILIKKN